MPRRQTISVTILLAVSAASGALGSPPPPWADSTGSGERPAPFQRREFADERQRPWVQAVGFERPIKDDQPSQLGQRDASDGKKRLRRPGSRDAQAKTPGIANPLVMTFASLAVVLGIFFLIMWIMRRHLPSSSAPLPSDVLEVLGRGLIGQKQPVHLVRLGDRLLLVAVNPDGMETLSEITDPDEATRLAGLCRKAHPQSATNAFRQVLGELANQPPRASKLEERDG